MTIAEDLLYHEVQFAAADFGFNLKTVLFILFFVVLLGIAIADIKTMTIPPVYNLIILVLGVASVFCGSWGIGIVNRLVGAISVSLPMLLIVWLIPNGFGGGDIKLMAAAGFLLGWKTNLVSFFIGLVTGGIYGCILLLLRKKGRKDHFAFGPFLCAGMVLAVFFGQRLIAWYFSLAEGLYKFM